MRDFKSGIFGRLGATVMHKLLGIVGLCLLATVIVAVIGIWRLSEIGHEIEGVAEDDMPLTEAVSRVTVHQLQQAVLLERILRLSGLVEETTAEELQAVEAEFEHLSSAVDEEIAAGERLAEAAIKRARSAEEKAEFEKVLEGLSQIESEHRKYHDEASEIFRLSHEGRSYEALELVRGVEEEEENLNHELEALLEEIETFTEAAVMAAEEHEKAAIWQMGVVSLVSAVLGFALAAWFTRVGVARPLAQVVSALNRLAAGDTTAEVNVKSKDEIGQVAEAFVTFKEKTLELKRLEEERAKEEERQREEKRRQMLDLADSFESTVGGVVGTVSSAATELQASAQTMSSTAEQTNAQSVTVASASEEASANVQTVATASEELSASIAEISRQIAETNQVSQQAVEEADKASQSVNGLAEAAQKIGAVVNLIQDIAEQTNLLALNATIEAARAGEAGKGFAVVAGEVKSLANQTAKATQEIGQQVESMQSATGGTVSVIEGIVTVIKRISENAHGIAAAVEQQNAATGEISRNVQEAAGGTQAVASNIQGVRQAAEQAGTAASDVLQAAQELSQQSELLRGEVGNFIAGLRTG
ncbi:methyl-accepting chemotaxis protein [Pelagibius marinus]|uniref:methyl-accepting chemotaxis protein n=1 Tax=Pelagibius marinus TaxID=2762760 RepID=UPI0018731B0A|nr:methyl-accepting chemotaxis protein [Pelagibius marinus]